MQMVQAAFHWAESAEHTDPPGYHGARMDKLLLGEEVQILKEQSRRNSFYLL